MSYVNVAELAPGSVLAEPVTDSAGHVLMRAGTRLSDRYVALLGNRGVGAVHVLEEGETVSRDETLGDRARAGGRATLAQLKRAIVAIGPRLDTSTPDALSASCETVDGRRLLRELRTVDLAALADLIVDDVLLAPPDAELRHEKSFDEYWVGHAFDVASIAVAIGRRVRLTQADMVALAHGCLLHDLGVLLMPSVLAAGAGPLSDEQTERLRLHPELGYVLARAMRPDATIANQIVLQHQERHDGSGFPRGLRGRSIGALSTDQREILRLAELCAVADVYDALSSDRPHRGALPADAVRTTLRRMAGTSLRREAVEALLDLVPLFPLGGRVTLISRVFPRFGGQVVRRNRDQPDRPVIRIYCDERGQPVQPTVIDLSQERGILIRPAV